MSLGGITLKSAEPSPISVKVKEVSTQPTMNLTEMGDEDWMHFEGEDGTIARKAGVEPKITYEKLSQDRVATMNDAQLLRQIMIVSWFLYRAFGMQMPRYILIWTAKANPFTKIKNFRQAAM